MNESQQKNILRDVNYVRFIQSSPDSCFRLNNPAAHRFIWKITVILASTNPTVLTNKKLIDWLFVSDMLNASYATYLFLEPPVKTRRAKEN